MIDNELLSVDNGEDKIVDADASLVAKEYYTSYAKYVLEYRALPSVYDGLKPVQRRIIYTANQYPKKLMKTAKLSGNCMGLHPHGSSSITGAINDMAHPANPLPLFTTHGNFGGVNFGPSSDRYTECYLSEVARMNFCQFIDYADYEVGEIGEMEPSALPTLIPYSLIRGSEGIAIGLSTKIMPLNLLDVIDYYIDFIKNDGVSDKFIKPDVGYVLLEQDKAELEEAVNKHKGRITVSSIVTQISDTSVLIEGLYSQSIESVIKKLNKWYGWFDKDQVGFRDSSTTSIKYVFEIYDNNITVQELKEALECATRRSGTYTRVVEEAGNAVYSSFNYVVKQSLSCLNKAIDNMIVTELSKCKSKLEVYLILDKCKEANVFKNITEYTTTQLVDIIMRTTSCSLEIAQDITKKPINYLTKSHNKEKQDLIDKVKELESHDRKSYLINLYKEFRRAVLPIYEERKHSVTKDMMIMTPCIKFNSSNDIRITDGDGEEFDNSIYFLSDEGVVYKRCISTTSESSLVIDTWSDELVGCVTDKYRYILITTNFNDPKYSKKYEGKLIIDTSNLSRDKKVLNLRQDREECIVNVEGCNSVPSKYKSALAGVRVTKSSLYEL